MSSRYTFRGIGAGNMEARCGDCREVMGELILREGKWRPMVGASEVGNGRGYARSDTGWRNAANAIEASHLAGCVGGGDE